MTRGNVASNAAGIEDEGGVPHRTEGRVRLTVAFSAGVASWIAWSPTASRGFSLSVGFSNWSARSAGEVNHAASRTGPEGEDTRSTERFQGPFSCFSAIFGPSIESVKVET